MNNKGFVSTTLIYTIFVIILSLMVYLMISYSNDHLINNQINNDARNDFIGSDITLEIYELDDDNSLKKVRELQFDNAVFSSDSSNICGIDDDNNLIFKNPGLCKIVEKNDE